MCVVADSSQGVQLATLQKLARYFLTEHDGRQTEAKLFPYPTLFRSRGRGARAPRRRAASRRHRAWCCARRPRDRKSTRLNSSHVANSYAVFCLKKKKKEPSLFTTEVRAELR